jgi:hypothetical protein
MSAGYMQLTALGQQDVWLTGEPQVTYFSGVYRRHTPFVLEAFEVPFLGQTVKYGSKSICRIPPKGDLVRGLTLTMTLPQLSPTFGGLSWYWPIPPDSSNTAQFVINTVSSAANAAPYSVTWYSTYNAVAGDRWLDSQSGSPPTVPLTNWVRYDTASNRFIFSNYGGGTLSTVWVKTSSPTSPGTNQGIFWGLDPLAATYITEYNGETWLGYAAQNNTLSPDLSLEQSGWLPNPTAGLPPAASRSGLYLQSAYPVTIGSSSTFINLAASYTGTSKYWTNWDAFTNYSITPAGRINFTKPGIYIMKVGFGLDSGSVSNVAWGQGFGDGPAGVTPSYSGSYEFRVSPNPSSPAAFPINISVPNSNVYVYASGTGASISAGSYITVAQADDYFYLKSNVLGSVANTKFPIDSSNTAASGSTTTFKNNDGSFTWTMATTGTYIISSVASMSNGYVTSATLAEGSNTLYTYDMSSQGRNPTFVFTMPLIVSDVARRYFLRLVCSNTTANVQTGTYFIFNQTGIPGSSINGTQGILPFSGLTFQPQSNTVVPTSNIFTSPLQISSSNFVSNGYPYSGSSPTGIISTSGTSNLIFTSNGTYVLTGALLTADQVTSLSINTWSSTGNTVTTYPVGLGLLPPYTVNIPFRISNYALSNTTILVTVNGTTTRPNLFSDTFISVYPFAVGVDQALLNFRYYDSVGTLAISSAELKIGGQTIQTLTGEAIELWNDLNVPYENQQALKVLTGKLDTTSIVYTRTYYINLPFYFFGSPELSVPICALERQDMEVHVTFKNFSELTSVTQIVNPALSNPVLNSTIIVEYVYLSEPEINWFRRSRIDQVILQYQYQTIKLPLNFSSGVFELKFNNPVRELFFVFQNDSSISYDFSESGLQSVGLSFNGYDAFTSTTADVTYLGTIEPYNHYINFPNRQFNMYCFCTNPGSVSPSGYVNFSRIKQVLMTLNMTPSSLNRRTCRLTAVNYNVLRIENGIAGLAFSSS